MSQIYLLKTGTLVSKNNNYHFVTLISTQFYATQFLMKISFCETSYIFLSQIVDVFSQNW